MSGRRRWPRHPHFGGPGTPLSVLLRCCGADPRLGPRPLRGLPSGQCPAHGSGRLSRGDGRGLRSRIGRLPQPQTRSRRPFCRGRGSLAAGARSRRADAGGAGFVTGPGPAGGSEDAGPGSPSAGSLLSRQFAPAGERWAQTFAFTRLPRSPRPAASSVLPLTGGEKVALAASGLLGHRPRQQLPPGPSVRPGRPAASQASSLLSAWGGAGPLRGRVEGGAMGHVPAEHEDPSPKGRARLRPEAATSMRSASSVQSREKSV